MKHQAVNREMTVIAHAVMVNVLQEHVALAVKIEKNFRILHVHVRPDVSRAIVQRGGPETIVD